MKLAVFTNLYPRPDWPTLGLYNEQLFHAMAGVATVDVICPVPEWRVWRWPSIRAWAPPEAVRSAGGLRVRYEPVFYVPVWGRSWSWRMYRRGLARAARSIDDADVVYSAWLYPDGVAAVRWARSRGKPGWMMMLGSDAWHLDDAARGRRILDACADASGIVCVAEHLAERLRQRGVAPDKLHVVPNGVDTERFRVRSRDDAVRELRARNAWPDRWSEDGRPLLLYVGHLVHVKGVDLLLDALDAHGAGAKWRLVLVGAGHKQADLERQAGGRAVFLGARPAHEVALWMNVADALCLPSRSEGMPNVVNEALASGLPVLATDVGACGSMLRDVPDCGVVPTNAEGLARGLMTLIPGGDVPTRARRRAAARLWGWHEMAAGIAGMLSREITERRRGAMGS